MKKILLILVLLYAVVADSSAQKFDEIGFDKFLKEISTVYGAVQTREKLSGNKVVSIHIDSKAEEAYKNISALLDKYDVFFAEEFMGLPLLFAIRESGVRKLVFYGYGVVLGIHDVPYRSMIRIVHQKGVDMKDIDISDIGFVTFDNNNREAIKVVEECVVEESEIQYLVPKDVHRALYEYYVPKIDSLRKQLKGVEKDRYLEIKKEIEAIENQYNVECESIRGVIDKLAGTSFVEIPCIGESYLVAPMLSAEEKMNVEPHAREGILDWINSTGFYKGYDNGIIGKNGQRSCVIYPISVVMEYVGKHSSKKNWNAYGYSPTIEGVFKREIQGGQPLYLYRVSDTEEGYNCMVNDLKQFFSREVGESYMNMEVVNRIETAECRFVQYYSPAGTVLLFDSPADKLCRMDVFVGGIAAFDDAVNDCTIDGVTGVAQKCNIVINLNEIDIIEGEYEKNGVSYKCGVHLETGYWEKLKGERNTKK